MYKVQIMPTGTLSAIARHYDDENPEPIANYTQLCMLNWNPDCPDREVWVHGLMGPATYRKWKEFVNRLDSMGFLRIRAFRKEGHNLPRARLHEDGKSFVIEISDLIRPEPNSSFAPL